MSEATIKRVVGFSGGIDSQWVSLWCRRMFDPADVILLNCNAGGNEHPLTEGFICWYSENVFPVITVPGLICDLGDVGNGKKDSRTKERRHEFQETDELTFDRLAYIKGRFPSRKAQFCTEYLKLAPQRRWMLENLAAKGIDCCRYVGVRRDESQVRASCPDSKWDDYFQCMTYFPAADKRKQEVFDEVLQAGEEINPLYRLGFNRVGCAPCVNASKDDIRNWAARFPEMIDKVRKWEQQTGRTFFAPILPKGEYGDVDRVVAWSKTVRGGCQLELPMFEAEAEGGRCVSIYGLCE